VYALGVILFELLSGRNVQNLKPGTRLSSLRTDIPAWLDKLLAKMLMKDPEQRPWDGAEVRSLLEASQKPGEHREDEKVGFTPARKSSVFRLLVVMMIVVLSGMALITWMNKGNEPPKITSTIPPVTATAAVLALSSSETPTLESEPTQTSTAQPTATLTHIPSATNTVGPSIFTGPEPPEMASVGDLWRSPVDGMLLAYIPEGEFQMGSEDGFVNEKPVLPQIS
jgi:serine/threonine protein kinase